MDNIWEDEGFREQATIPVSLGDVADLAKRLADAVKGVTVAEENLRECKEALRLVQEEALPAAMAKLGLSEIKLDTGEKVSVSTYYSASIAAENKAVVFEWLHEHGHGDIIKHAVSVDFKKGEAEAARAAVDSLANIGLAPKDEIKVAPMTLKAFVKEELEAGRELPPELNVYVGQRATVKGG